MPKANHKNYDEEQLSSDDSGVDDRSKSDEEYENDGNDDNDNSYSESDGGDYSDDGSNGSYSEDDKNDDPYDYEKGDNSEGFDDEESSKNPRYVVNQRFSDDGETENNDNWWEGREKLIAGILLCWCCLALIIIAVVLGVVLGGKNRDDTSPEIVRVTTERPTFAPIPIPPSAFTSSPTESAEPSLAVTLSPTIQPTARPTTSPTDSFAPTKSIPEYIEVIADQDTYTQYNVSKEFQGEEYGHEDTFLVQKVPLRDEELADSVAVLSFPIEDVPLFSRIEGMEKSAVLRLTHAVSTEERPPANYTIIRIPETKTKMEYWHGFYFVPPLDNETGVLVGPTFEVSPIDSVIDIDVSALFFNYTMEDNKKPKKAFFMIENRGPDQVEGGDRFYTRESKTPPQLTLNIKSGVEEEEPEVGTLEFEDDAGSKNKTDQGVEGN